MDYNLKPSIIRSIRDFRARALAAQIEQGTPAERRKRDADLICKTHFVAKLREAEARRDIRAATLRRALIQEGIFDMTKTGDPIIDRQLKSAKAKAVAAIDMDLFNAGLPSVADVQSMTKTLTALKRDVDTLKARPATVKVIDAPKPAEPKPAVKRPNVARCFTTAATAEFMRRVERTSPEETIKALMPGDEMRLNRRLARQMLKSDTSVGTTTAPGFASELVQSDTLQFWSEVAPASILGALLGYARRVDFGRNGSLLVPKRADGDNGSMRPRWISENATIPTAQGQTDSVTLNRYKLGVISSFSNELAQTSLPNIADLIQSFIFDDLTVAMDAKLLSSDAAVAGTSPAGLLLGVTPLTPAADPMADIRQLLQTLAPIRPRRPVWVMDVATHIALMTTITDSGVYLFRTAMEQGNLFGYPFIVSANVADTLALMDADSLFLTPPVPEIDVSSSATVVMASNDAPAPVMGDAASGSVSTGDSINVSDASDAGAEVRNMFQTNGQALRTVVDGVCWQWARSGAIAVVTPGWN